MLQNPLLKQAFQQDIALQEKIMLISNIFSNRLNNFSNSFKKKYVIRPYPNRTAINLWLLAIRRIRVIGYSNIEEEDIKWNRISSFSEIQ